MTLEEAVELVGKWPEDRSVPRKLAEAIATASDADVPFMAQLVEVLTTASVSEDDYKLIERYF